MHVPKTQLTPWNWIFFLFFFFKITFVYYFNQLVVIIQSPELDCTPVFPESVKINTVEDSSVK